MKYCSTRHGLKPLYLLSSLLFQKMNNVEFLYKANFCISNIQNRCIKLHTASDARILTTQNQQLTIRVANCTFALSCEIPPLCKTLVPTHLSPKKIQNLSFALNQTDIVNSVLYKFHQNRTAIARDISIFVSLAPHCI